MKGRMMRRLVTLCLFVLIVSAAAAFVAIVLWDSDDAIIKWLALVFGVFSTELLGMLLKKILEDKRAAKNAAERKENPNEKETVWHRNAAAAVLHDRRSRAGRG